MIGLPKVVHARVNAGRSVCGSWLDNEYVLHRIRVGTWEFRLNGRASVVRAGHMVLLYPRLLHMVRPLSTGALEQQVVHFELTAADSQPGRNDENTDTETDQGLVVPSDQVRLGKLYRVPLIVESAGEDRRHADRLFRTLIQEWQTGGDAKELMVGGLVAQLLALYIRGGAARTVPERPRAPVWTALERGLAHIHARHADPHLTLDGMAQAAGLSRHYFCRVFRTELGMSPYQYLLRYRIDQAQRLLLGSKWNCSEAALRTGFPSIHQFSKVFRRLTGRSPSKWRKHPG